MFVYHYRIFDLYNLQVFSLAVLGDGDRHWLPEAFTYDNWGCELGFRFPIVKLLTLADLGQTLETSAGVVPIGSNAGNTARLASGGRRPPVLLVRIALVSTGGLRPPLAFCYPRLNHARFLPIGAEGSSLCRLSMLQFHTEGRRTCFLAVVSFLNGSAHQTEPFGRRCSTDSSVFSTCRLDGSRDLLGKRRSA
jgi:hypothetical protein